MKCSVENCESGVVSGGLCVKHYTRFLRYGNVNTVLRPRGEALKLFTDSISASHDECISWPFTTTGRDGRPWIQYKGRRGYAAIFMCEIAHGERPEGKQAAHNCGNAGCINPNHLRWATPKENAADKVLHGTAPRGEAQGSSKLKNEDVRRIRELALTMKIKDIHALYPVVHPQQIRRIVNRKRWEHFE